VNAIRVPGLYDIVRRSGHIDRLRRHRSETPAWADTVRAKYPEFVSN
jgi:hypothetical protein